MVMRSSPLNHRPRLACVLREGRKNANIHAGSGVIWGIPVQPFRGLIATPLCFALPARAAVIGNRLNRYIAYLTKFLVAGVVTELLNKLNGFRVEARLQFKHSSPLLLYTKITLKDKSVQ